MIKTLIFSLLSGILPALIWLWFWLREDTDSPEPKKIVALTFLGGMLAVIFVLPIQSFVRDIVQNGSTITILWAGAEELLKFLAVFLFAYIGKKVIDEPIDFMVYMITAALGFSALENTFFLYNPINNALLGGSIVDSFMTGNLRFVGATLLHVACSASLGFLMAVSFYKNRLWKFLSFIVGVVLATGLHTVFNLSIIKSKGSDVFIVFSFVWLFAVVLLLLFEETKRIRRNNNTKIVKI